MAERFKLVSLKDGRGEFSRVFSPKLINYLDQVPFSCLIDTEDEEYKDMQVAYALVKEESQKAYLFEFDWRNLDKLKQVIAEPCYFYVQMLYEEVPLRHYLRILALDSSSEAAADQENGEDVEEMVLYPRRELC